MIRTYTPEAIRRAEEPLLRAGVPLMSRASGALALTIQREYGRYGVCVFVLVGPGNNGGDALYAAARLARQASSVAALCFGQVHAQALEEARACGVRIYDAAPLNSSHNDDEARRSELLREIEHEARRAHVWVDGLLGIGGRAGLRGAMRDVVSLLVDIRQTQRVVAVDLPSGVDALTGAAPGIILRADLTVTFGAGKPALYVEPARRYAGRIHTVDIGLGLDNAPEESIRPIAPTVPGEGEEAFLPEVCILESTKDMRWPVPGPDDHKYTRGVVGIRAGSHTYPGAAFLCVEGALAAGTGMVRYVGPVRDVLLRNPEVVLGAGRVNSWVFGPGLDAQALEEALPAYLEALQAGLPIVLDAGAVAFARHACAPNVVLTPHAGELSALFRAFGKDIERSRIEEEPLFFARQAARLTGAVVLLKGAVDIACPPEGSAYASAGSPWRAVAGSGDVLAGLVGAALASGLEPVRAAAEAAYLHAAASANKPTHASMIARGIAAARVANW